MRVVEEVIVVEKVESSVAVVEYVELIILVSVSVTVEAGRVAGAGQSSSEEVWERMLTCHGVIFCRLHESRILGNINSAVMSCQGGGAVHSSGLGWLGDVLAG